MASESVTTNLSQPEAQCFRELSLWLGEDQVLSICLDRNSKGFPPVREHPGRINMMIQDLARAAKATIYQAENDPKGDASFHLQPISGITDAIILLSQLSDAVQGEILAGGK